MSRKMDAKMGSFTQKIAKQSLAPQGKGLKAVANKVISKVYSASGLKRAKDIENSMDKKSAADSIEDSKNIKNYKQI